MPREFEGAGESDVVGALEWIDAERTRDPG